MLVECVADFSKWAPLKREPASNLGGLLPAEESRGSRHGDVSESLRAQKVTDPARRGSTHVFQGASDPTRHIDCVWSTTPVRSQERVVQQLPVRRSSIRDLLEAARDKVAGVVRVRVGKRRRVTVHDRRQLRKDVLVCLGRVRVVADRELNDRKAEGPDVGRGRVG